MITGEVTGVEKVVAHFGGMNDRVHVELRETIKTLGFDLQAYIQRNKLSGQVLKNRSGHLRGSIHPNFYEDASSISAIVGTNVEYAAIHEYGFDGNENVREHLRTITQAFGHAINPVTFTVHAYSRQMHMPVRSFLRTSLAENANHIKAEMQAAVQRGTK